MEDTNNEKKKEIYEVSSSRIGRIYIPLPKFRYFHKPSEVNEVDSRFIGRENIIKMLENWLSIKDGNDSGSYLITGYRGMGKSSFVGKVINQLIDSQRTRQEGGAKSSSSEHGIRKKFYKYFALYSVMFSSIGLFLFYLHWGIPYLMPLVVILGLSVLIVNMINSKIRVISMIIMYCYCAFILLLLLSLTDGMPALEEWVERIRLMILKYSPPSLFKDILFSFGLFAGLCVCIYMCKFFSLIIENNKKGHEKKKSAGDEKYINVININLGNEVSGEREILALIANSLKLKFDFFYKERFPSTKFPIFTRSVAVMGIVMTAFVIYYFGIGLINDPGLVFLSKLSPEGYGTAVFYSLNDLLVGLRNNPFLNGLLGGAFSLGLAWLIYEYMVSRVILWFFKFVGRPLTVPGKIQAKIYSLCERVDSSIDEDNDPYGSVGVSSFSLSLKRKRTRKYQQAGVREIEQELINIINEIGSSAILNSRFIIILDELDKIDINNKDDKEEHGDTGQMPEFSFDENGITDYRSVNQKKRRVLHLLGQLKYFISTTKAKFVFIAGRELYDAYLADVSDREFSVSSIFNGVINVDSFFSCNSQTKDITKLTETYVCNQLMKEEAKGEAKADIDRYNIKEYVTQLDEKMRKEEKDKLIAFIRQFITYLTFVSNGAPKKLTANFEKYVISKEEYQKQKRDADDGGYRRYIIRSDKDDEDVQYYLAFGYYDQQKIGFIHYMAYPIFENVISPSSEYGDKLLVSSSFLLAHIYKHHSSGFSWRNLEYMPELIDNHRIPELREYINSIIGHLGKMHLSSIASGIYSYKFPMRLVEEISVFTKKSEEISAIFNFSLDYSNSVKKYYYRLLDYHRKENRYSPITIANLHHYLGDIHMANDEYTEAIVQFRVAVDILNKHIQNNRDTNDDELSSYVIRYARAMLKLGLAYEKRNTMDSAYMVYNDLTLKLVRHRDIREDELGLQFKIENTSVGSMNADTSAPHKHVLMYKPLPNEPKKVDYWEKYYPYSIKPKDSNKLKYWIYGEQLIDNLCDFLTPDKSALISKLSIYEDLRLAYLPILAKLFSIEKQNICGITKDNIKIAESEFNYLFLITNSKDKYLLSVDFYRKLGDILYYKNRHFSGARRTLEHLFNCWGYDIKTDAFDYCYNHGMEKKDITEVIDYFTKVEKYYPSIVYSNTGDYQKFVEHVAGNKILSLLCRKSVEEILNNVPVFIKQHIRQIINCSCKRGGEYRQNFPCFSCRYYKRSLLILMNNLIPPATKQLKTDMVVKFLIVIEKEVLLSSRQNELVQVALTLDSVGHVMLSCSTRKEAIGVRFVRHCILKGEYMLHGSFNNLEKAMLCYKAAMKYHYKTGNYKEGTNCVVKLMNILSSYIQVNKDHPHTDDVCSLDKADLQQIEEVYIAKAIEQAYAAKNYSGFQKINKFRWDIGEKDKFDLGLTSIMPDIEEVLLAFYEIKLKLGKMGDKELSYLYKSPALTFLRCDSLSYNRVISLLFKANLNEYMLGKLLSGDIKKNGDGTMTINEEFYKNYLKQGGDLKVHTILSHGKVGNASDPAQMLEFLISDSILCLLYITDFLSPSIRTTLFTNSFCGGIYRRLYMWVLRKEALLRIYKDKVYEENRNRFTKALENKSESYARNVLRTTYLGEMANMFYANAMEMQSEGQSYQNFIQGFYIIDDDLQNDTCQFYIALERYKINLGNIEKDKIILVDKGYYTASAYFGMIPESRQP